MHNSLIGYNTCHILVLVQVALLFFIHPFVQEQGSLALLMTGSDCIEDTGKVSPSC